MKIKMKINKIREVNMKTQLKMQRAASSLEIENNNTGRS